MRSANTGLSLWGTDTSGTLAGTQPGSEPRKTLRTQIKGPGKGHHPEQTRPHALAALTARRAPQEGKVSKQSHPYSQPHTRVHTHTHTSTQTVMDTHANMLTHSLPHSQADTHTQTHPPALSFSAAPSSCPPWPLTEQFVSAHPQLLPSDGKCQERPES